MGRVTDHVVELERRHRVCYSLTVRLHEADLNRLREMIEADPEDFMLTLLGQVEDTPIILGTWTYERLEPSHAEGRNPVPPSLKRTGLRVVRRRSWVEPGTIYIPMRAKSSRLCECRGPDLRCQEKVD